MVYKAIKDYTRTEEPKFSLVEGQKISDQQLAEIFHKSQISKHGDKQSFLAQIAKYGSVVAKNLISDGVLVVYTEPKKKADVVEPAVEAPDQEQSAIPKTHAFLKRK